ncbi:hypothetical protein [Myroides sp. DW712]|uniref:hypothetical protein n=1 Tax=Myroides sp. DW712 TaxID=3389800 RepID=UPI00397CAED1
MKKVNLWRKTILAMVFILCTSMSYGQRIQQDVFNNLVYQSDHYQAKLKKNIFDDLTFSDSNNNIITFNKAYLEKKMGVNYNEADTKSMFFQDLVLDYMQIRGYEASYKVDIFGTLTLTDNQGKTLTAKEDIFGHRQIKHEHGKKSFDIQTTSTGELSYKATNQSATLAKDSDGTRTYTDSNDTKIVMTKSLWERLIKKHQTESNLFIFLIEQFLLSSE